MGTKTGHKKRGLMDRLRRLRSIPALQPNTTTHASDDPPPYTSQKFTDGKTGNGWPPGSKSHPKQSDQFLDLEKLDSKLEQWAKERRLAGEIVDMEDDSETADEPTTEQAGRTDGGTRAEEEDGSLAPQSKDDKPAIGPEVHSEAGEIPDTALEATQGPEEASIPLPQQGEVTDAVIHHPADPEADTEPSDFDVFLKKAEEEERLRQEKGDPGRSAKAKREQPLNHFYANNWAERGGVLASSKPNLTEIRESDDPTIDQQQHQHQQQHHTEDEPAAAAATAAAAEASNLTSAMSTATASDASTASSGSHDFADPTALQYTATAQTGTSSQHKQPRVGRHVSFTEPPTTIIPPTIRERSASYPVMGYGRRTKTASGSGSRNHGQVRFESPRGSGRRRQGGKKGIGRIFAGLGR